MKECCTCKQIKDLSEFTKDKAAKDGLSKRCKSCIKERNAIWYQKNGIDQNKKQKEYWLARYWPKLSTLEALNEYQKLIELQNNECAICKISFDTLNQRPDIDHDHESGLVRGILCNPCNRGIGYLKDSVVNIQSAFEYLKKFKA